MLEIYVHFGLEEAAAGSVVADTLGTLRDKIKADFSKKGSNYDANELIADQRCPQQAPSSS